jgi:hypothetical protein
MANYCEPTYPLTKTEKFCEDTMKGILVDEAFSKSDRARLSQYNKHKVGAGRVLVSYRLGLGCEELKLGRLFPEEGLGIQAFSRIMRNPLMAKNYWDLDIENCHYRIAEQYAEEHGLKHDKISEYCDKRDEILAMTSNSRIKAKTEFLKLLYGGNIKLYDETFVEQEGDISIEGNQFLVDMKKEIFCLMESVWNAHPHLHKFKAGGKGAVPINKKPNPKASLMSLVFQTREREILMWIDWVLRQSGRPFCVLIHDGGYIEKLANETEAMFEDWLEGVYDLICNIPECITLSVKPITHDWKPSPVSLSPYERIKIEFEKTHAIVGGNLVCIHADGKREVIKLKRDDPRFSHLNWFDTNNAFGVPMIKYFLAKWLDDHDVIRYDRMDFIPDRTKCPEKVYNLFDGFEADKLKYAEMTDEKIDELIKPIKRHLDLLTTNNGDWILDWLSNIIQDPMNRSQVAPLIRDEGNMLVLGGGTGKTSFFDWVMNEIIGDKYCYSVANNAEMYESFNGRFEGKLLVVVEEANGDANFKNNDTLKAKLTSKKTSVNKKGIESYEVQDYSRWCFFSNNRNPIAINSHSRRFAVMDTNPAKRGDDVYFTKLFAHLALTEVKVAFFRFLKMRKEVPKSPIDWFKSIPNTNALREVMTMNSPPIIKWILYNLKAGLMRDGYVYDLYVLFRSFIKEKREGKEETTMTETAFGIMLGKNKEAGGIDIGDKHRTASGQFFKWNIDSILTHLKAQLLVDDDFVYGGHYVPVPPVTDSDETDE